MADLPILFSAPMVRALLSGTKTQTRRVIKPQPYGRISMLTSFNHGRMEIAFGPDMKAKDGGPKWWRPLAQAGDRMWVRETGNWRGPMKNLIGAGSIRFTFYAADSARGRSEFFDDKNKPGIFMPRWASRLTLYVTDVRVERLQDISEEDARAEGVECDTDGWRDYQIPSTQCCATPIASYRTLWDSINGPGSWDANPWVAAYTFAVRLGNIDTLPATLQEVP